jgi:hypothetical protein
MTLDRINQGSFGRAPRLLPLLNPLSHASLVHPLNVKLPPFARSDY